MFVDVFYPICGENACYALPICTPAAQLLLRYKWFQTHSRFTLYAYELMAMVYIKLVGWV